MDHRPCGTVSAGPLTLTIEDNDVPEPVPALPLLGQLLLALGLTGAGARRLSRRPRATARASGIVDA